VRALDSDIFYRAYLSVQYCRWSVLALTTTLAVVHFNFFNYCFPLFRHIAAAVDGTGHPYSFKDLLYFCAAYIFFVHNTFTWTVVYYWQFAIYRSLRMIKGRIPMTATTGDLRQEIEE